MGLCIQDPVPGPTVRLQALSIPQQCGRDSPCNCRDTKPPVYPHLSRFPRKCWSSPQSPGSLPLTPTQEHTQKRAGLQGWARFPAVPDHAVLCQPPHWNSDYWVRFPDFMTSACVAEGTQQPCSPQHLACSVSGASSCKFSKENKKNLIVSFLSHWVSGWVLVGGRYAGGRKTAVTSSHALSVFEIQWWKRLWEGGGALAGEYIPRPAGLGCRLSYVLHKWFILAQSVFLRWGMTIPGHDQVSLEKQREGRANGTTGVRRERGIREKAHDETGV